MAIFELFNDTVVVDNKTTRYYFRYINNILECESRNPYSQSIEKLHLTNVPKYIIKEVNKLIKPNYNFINFKL